MGLKDKIAAREYSRARYQIKKLSPGFMEAQREAARERYRKNPELAKASTKKYRQLNPDKVAMARRIYAENMSDAAKARTRERKREYDRTDAMKEKKKEYNAKNREKKLEYLKKWRKENHIRFSAVAKKCNERNRDAVSRSYVAALVKIPARELSDEYLKAHAATLKLKRLIKELKNENA